MARKFLVPANFGASTTAAESLNIAVGVAPTTPAIGAVWHQTDGLYYRNNSGVSVGPLAAAGTTTLTNTFVGYGNGANALVGSATLTYTPTTGLAIAQTAVSTGVQTALSITGALNTGLTASTEVPDLDLNFARVTTWATGNFANQRTIRISAQTLAAAATSVITNAATLSISGAPIQGANMTLTNTRAFWVESGRSHFDGQVVMTLGAQVPVNTTPTLMLTRSTDGYVFVVEAPNMTGTPAFSVQNVPLSTDVNTGKGFELKAAGEGFGRAMFYSDGKYAIGPGNAIRDTIFSRSAANTFRVSSDGASGAGHLEVMGRISIGVAVSATNTFTLTQAVAVTGAPTALVINGGAHTTLTTTAEAIDVDFNLARVVQWATGAITTQRAALFRAPTYAFVAASTVGTAATVAISGAPIAGLNATFTNAYALWVQAGVTKLDGGLSVTGTIAATSTVTGSNLSGTNSGDQTITLTGNVTGSGTGSFATTIAANVVTNAMLAQVATATFQGRVTAATGNVETLTGTQATTLLDVFTTALKGLAPASGGGTANFLRADGTWAVPPASTLAWSSLTAPTANLSLAMAANTTTFTWNATTGAGVDLFTLTDTAANTGTGYLLAVKTQAGSAAKPFSVYAADNGNVGTVADFYHDTAGKAMVMNFNSRSNVGSDRGFLLFQDNSAMGLGGGGGSERARLTVGVFNDLDNVNGEELWFQGMQRVVSNVGTWDSEMTTLIGATSSNITLTNTAYEWRANNAAIMTMLGNGSLGLGISPTASFHVSQVVSTSGTPTALRVAGGAHTTLATTVEAVDLDFNLSRTVQWATGAITTQRAALFRAPTYAFVAASVVTNAATVAITGAPVAGAFATLTNAHALWVQSGQTRLDGGLYVTGAITALVNSAVSVSGTINDFLQYDIQNTSAGTSACTGYSSTADNGTATTGFMWTGINNSTFALVNAYSIGGPNDTVVLGSGQDLYIANAHNTKDIIFELGRAATPFFDEFMRIKRSVNGITITPPASTSGTPTILSITGPASTALATTVESTDVNINLSRTVQWSTGAIANQRAMRIQAPTYAFVAASTITSASTLSISGAPAAGANATITAAAALNIEGGNIWVGTMGGTFGNTSGRIIVASGSATLPAISFCEQANATSDSGFYGIADGSIGLTTNGVLRLTTTTAQFTATLPWRGQNGTAAAPAFSFSGDTNCGIYDIAADQIGFSTNGVLRHAINTSASAIGFDWTQGIATTGSPVGWRFAGAAHTTLTLSTEATDVQFALARTVQFATGALTTQRAFVITAPTYAFVAASVITTAATVAISGAPVAGAFATINNAYSLWVQAGTTQLDGGLGVTGTISATSTVTGSNLSGTNTGDQTITLTGNVTGSGTGSFVTTIGTNVVTLAMLAQVATATFRGRITAGTGNVEVLTGTQATTLLDSFTSTLKGLTPASGGGTTTFLRADGTWTVPAANAPAGATTQVQFNDAGAFGGNAGFTFDKTTKLLTVTNNAAAVGSLLTGTLHVTQGADGSNAISVIAAYGTGISAGYNGRVARGTGATPTAIQLGDEMVRLAGRGYGTTGYSTAVRGYLTVFAAENWTDTAQGTSVSIYTTANGGIVTTESIRFWADGGVSVNTYTASLGKGSLDLTQGVQTTGSPTGLRFTGGAHTTLATTVEATDINFNLARTVQFATGAITTQRAVRFQAPTYAFVAASTITNAATVAISGAPTAGANATLSNAWSLWVQAGTSRFDGTVDCTGQRLYSGRYLLGTDLSLIPIVGGQSAVTTWWGMQLVGNQQSNIDYTPANIGAAGDFSVIIPNQQAGAIGLIIRGQTAQTGNLLQFNNIGATGLSAFNSAGRLGLGTVAPTSELHVVQAVATTGSPTAVLFTGAAHTTLTLSVEAIDVNINLARTVQFATGALTTQRAMLIQAPTYAFVAASTLTNAATLAISGAPAAGANATITNPYALWVQSGNVRVDGGLFSLHATAGIGYLTGSGGTVTQATSKATAITLSKVCGTITLNGAALASATGVAFTWTNTAIAASDTVVCVHDSVGTLGAYGIVVTPGNGSATVTVRNNSAGSLSEAIVLRFVIVKTVTS